MKAKRNNKVVSCKECGKTTKVNGLANYFKNIHNMTIQEYVDKHGEYRKKYKDYKKRSKKSDIVCKVCNKNMASERRLTYHLKGKHGLSKKEYIINYLLDGEVPKCKCGCGEDVKIKDRGSPPYWSDYISGHNTQETHVGMKRSYESRMKMRESAIERLKNENSVFYRGRSKDEEELGKFLNKIWKGEMIVNDKELLSGKELDFYFPTEGIAIELNGDRFHSDLFKDKNYHINKTNECKRYDVHLIHIWLNDWIVSGDIIKSQLRHIFNKTERRIYARNTEIREVSFNDAKKFINTNHLQGYAASSIRHGLYKDDELLQIMTFGKLRNVVNMKSKDNHYELIRMCNKLNSVVVGGASKLFKYFIKTNDPEYILSYANKDWSNGGMYDKLGMRYIGDTSVGYFYSNEKRKENRYKYQKHKLVEMGYDENKTEYEIMSDRGYYRIWDTGNLKFEWTSDL